MDFHLYPTLLTGFLFLGYSVLWKLKSRSLWQSAKLKVEVIEDAEEPSQRYFNQLQKLMKVSCIALIILHAYPHSWLPGMEPNPSMNQNSIKVAGFLIGIVGLVICRIAQVTMGKAWRVGIDPTARAGLVTSGIFRMIRNPTYTGLFILCTGVLLINPTALFSHWVLSFVLMMEFQVRKEEEYLTAKYGEEYNEYKRGSKRYIPFVY